MGLRTETGLAVTLDVRPRPAWLGQQLALTVRVADLGGTPRGGVAVTVHTGAGRLVWSFATRLAALPLMLVFQDLFSNGN